MENLKLDGSIMLRPVQQKLKGNATYKWFPGKLNGLDGCNPRMLCNEQFMMYVKCSV
jgi:hypothetical protein